MQNSKMICVLLSFLTMLLPNYRVAEGVELKGGFWRRKSTIFGENIAILVLKEDQSLRSKNISEVNTPSLNSVAFFIFPTF